MMTVEQVLKVYKIDTKLWEVEKFKIKPHEGYRKDRKVRWIVKGGTVIDGHVEDSGKMLVVPLYGFEVTLVKRKNVEDVKKIISDMWLDARKHKPTYPTFRTPKKTGLMLEVILADFHYGRLGWKEESGEDIDINISADILRRTIGKLIDRSKGIKFEQVILPIVGDYFNSDHQINTTTKGTFQVEDTRWQKTFRKGRQLAVEIIDMLAYLAPAKVIMLRGNHDNQRSFYLGDSLSSWYNRVNRVTIDNLAAPRKYFPWGRVLLGFAHGHMEKKYTLPMLMAKEAKNDWVNADTYEFHVGHIHQKRLEMYEEGGVVVKSYRALTPQDAWTVESGYMSKIAAESNIWSRTEGWLGCNNAQPT
jgi:predicted phosphodiesterase